MKILSENIEKHQGLLNLDHETNPNSYRELMPWFCKENQKLMHAISYDLVYREFIQ